MTIHLFLWKRRASNEDILATITCKDVATFAACVVIEEALSLRDIIETYKSLGKGMEMNFLTELCMLRADTKKCSTCIFAQAGYCIHIVHVCISTHSLIPRTFEERKKKHLERALFPSRVPGYEAAIHTALRLSYRIPVSLL